MNDPRTLQSVAARKWDIDDGEYTHRITFSITNESLVYDVGGYNGRWAAWIAKKYNPTVHIFEPVKEYYGHLLERFESNSRVSVFNYGLLDRNQTAKIVKAGGQSSLYIPGEDCEDAEFRDIADLPAPQLISINVEGAEYPLLQRMLDTGWAQRCSNIQVQFHAFYPDCDHLRESIRKRLSETHREVYNYPFVWEAWTLK
jgi:FkbM family methyltransferase